MTIRTRERNIPAVCFAALLAILNVAPAQSQEVAAPAPASPIPEKEIASLEERFNDLSLESYNDLIQAVRLQNMLVVSEMVVRSALMRTESRGAHYRTDYPDENNDAWLRNIIISKTDGEMSLSTAPVDLSRMSP